MLRRAAEKIIRIANHKLIERGRGCHEDGTGATAATACAAGPLPGSGDRPGISRHHHGIERANIDAQLQRARRHHTANSCIAQSALDLAALVRQIAAAIAANRFRFARPVGISLLQIRQQQLGVQTRIREHDRLQLMFQEFLRHTRGFVDVAAADSQRAIHHRRIVENKSLLRGRRAIRVEHLNACFQKPRCKLPRIRDCCRRADELRLTPVKSGDPSQSAQHVAQVAAEDSAICVQLIDHDVAQILEESCPARVVRQNPRVQHVRIREHNVPLLPDGFARIAGRVAVIGENAEAILEALIQVVQLGELVLRKRLRGEEIERAAV